MVKITKDNWIITRRDDYKTCELKIDNKILFVGSYEQCYVVLGGLNCRSSSDFVSALISDVESRYHGAN